MFEVVGGMIVVVEGWCIGFCVDCGVCWVVVEVGLVVV